MKWGWCALLCAIMLPVVPSWGYITKPRTVQVKEHSLRLDLPDDWKVTHNPTKRELLNAIGVDGLKSITLIVAPLPENIGVYDPDFIQSRIYSACQYADEVYEQRHYAINGVPAFTVSSVKHAFAGDVYYESASFAVNGHVYTLLVSSHFGDIMKDDELQSIVRSLKFDGQLSIHQRATGGVLIHN